MTTPILRLTLVAILLPLAGCPSAAPTPVINARSADGLAYDLVGEGPVVVLIHGTNLDRRMWDGEIAWLQDHARVLRYDLRGQGASDDPKSTYSNHGDLIALLDELDVREASLVGLSAGAQVALDVALTNPDRVQRMVLASPSLSGYRPESLPPFFTDLMAALQARDYRLANEVLLDSPIMSVPPPYADPVRTMVHDNTRLWTMDFTIVEQVSPPAIERLSAIRTPTLILVGGNDLGAIRDQGALLEQQTAGARLVTITEGGHLLNMTSPQAFREAVSAFLDLPRD